MKHHYQVVVIGSGYGGSIAASRMARAGLSVCLLEKGREIRPGDYPEKELEGAKEIHVDSQLKSIGRENALYHFSVHQHISVFSGVGLGGTSLVNANVSLTPEEWVFQDKAWPKQIRENTDALYQGIERAKKVLQPNPYPEKQKHYGPLKKLEAQKKVARNIGGKFNLAPINVRFKDGKNAVGYQQKKCTNCGDCVTGCNVGAKNTTLMNYLPDAVNFGADIFTEVKVTRLSHKKTGKWLVYYKIMGSGEEKFSPNQAFVSADFVFLGAGSLGSTHILLESKAKGLSTSDQVGQQFTGNGDVLGFAYNSDQKISAIGLGHHKASRKYVPPGPCITSMIDKRKEGKKEQGIVIEEGVMPGPISALLPSAFIKASRLVGKDTDKGIKDKLAEKWREFQSKFRGAYRGATAHTQTFLSMGHDDGKGEMVLNEGRLTLKWPGVGRQPIVQKIHQNLKKASKALGLPLPPILPGINGWITIWSQCIL